VHGRTRLPAGGEGGAGAPPPLVTSERNLDARARIWFYLSKRTQWHVLSMPTRSICVYVHGPACPLRPVTL
jgi:hypothetical protein